MTRLRWWLVRWLCRVPSACNASVICWGAWADRAQVTGGRWKQTATCRSDAKRNGSCYCGKISGGAS